MSPKDGQKQFTYESLREKDFNYPFTFTQWQMEAKHENMRNGLRERKYTVKDTGIPHRVVNHWENIKLMPEGVLSENRQKDAKWRTFSLVEMAWLKIVARLRNFGLSLKQIAEIKSQIIHWNSKFGYYPLFEYELARSLYSSTETYLVVRANREAKLMTAESLEMEKVFNGSDDMLLVSIKSILKELGLSFPEIKNKLELSDDEIELLKDVRNKEDREIKATRKGGRIKEIETVETRTDIPKDEEIRKEAEKEGRYGRTVVQYENGKQRSIQVVRRRRLE